VLQHLRLLRVGLEAVNLQSAPGDRTGHQHRLVAKVGAAHQHVIAKPANQRVIGKAAQQRVIAIAASE
jgi:hypothetical protein